MVLTIIRPVFHSKDNIDLRTHRNHTVWEWYYGLQLGERAGYDNLPWHHAKYLPRYRNNRQ